jgi:Tfp pilus assembly protein PilV
MLFNDRGLTIVEAAIAMLMLAIIFVGIGYMVKTVPMKQRAYHATTRDEDALTLSYLLTQNIKHASEITSPAEPTVNAATTASTLEMRSMVWDATATPPAFVDQRVEFSFSAGNQQILWCHANAADCVPNEVILSSWDNGRVGAESTIMIGAANGTIFRRGIDVDGNGTLSTRERHYIRVELVLSQNEGPAGNQHNIDNQVFYIEALGNVNNVRNPN